ncbi:hypothetical protein HJFPF1_00328 [Paramyrothecium foliicola]|nr:hypothetical protein HJFPF1_00328 [Paramyrothecium foliicola]
MLDHKPQNRPARSNSLQRMLELEKQFMVLPPAISPNDAATTQRSQPPAARTNAQFRRRDVPPPSASRSSSRSPREASFSSQPPPLVIHAEPPKSSLNNAAEHYASLAVMVDDIHVPEIAVASDKPSPKVVAFQFPPEFEDRRSVCQSPSWEAYDRRKRERKDEKKEEKRREEERREKKKEEERRREAEKKEQQNASRKPRRLSKPPPVTAQTQDEIKAASQTGLTVPRTQKVRPASVLGITFSSHDDESERPNRKRSGSFTSLIRAPFESRRASFDHTGDNGFIGGIKLEQERFDAQQRADEANIHPALRKSKPESRSSSPPRSPRKSTGRNSNDPGQRRAYPPITILNSSNKNRPLAAPDLSRMDKLRARVGLKTTVRNEKADGHLTSSPATETAIAATSDVSLPPYNSDVEKTHPRHSKDSFASMSPSLAPEPLRLNSEKTGTARRNVNEKALNIRIPDKDEAHSPEISAKSSPRTPKDHTILSATNPKDGEPTLSELMAQDSIDGPEPVLLLPPLRPPRKSSKRSLPTSSSASSPATATTRGPSEQNPSATSDTPHDFFELFDGTYSPPSLELKVPEDNSPAKPSRARISEDSAHFTSRAFQSNSLGITPPATNLASRSSLDEVSGRVCTERRSRDTTRPSLGKLVTSSSSDREEKQTNQRHGRHTGGVLSNLIVSGRSRSSSSEEFSSDELQYHSPLSTPGTSRPQSEKGSTPVLTDTELGPSLVEPRKSTYLRQQITQDDLAPPPAYGRHHQRKQSQHSEIEDEIELDRIQEAARKVRAAFPPPSPLRNSTDRRSQSDPDVAASAGFLPKLKLRKDKTKLDQLSPSSEAEKNSMARAQLLGATSKAKSAVHLPQTTKSQLMPSSPALSPMSLPTPTFHLPLQPVASSPDAAGKSRLSRASRPSMDSHRSSGADGTVGGPVAKMFVECCGCRYYHDMPSRLYETMANPSVAMSGDDALAHRGSKAMTVRCPWCQHDMSTKCCAGLAAMVYVKERLH